MDKIELKRIKRFMKIYKDDRLACSRKSASLASSIILFVLIGCFVQQTSL